ncbi:MAG: translation initiation factor IF-2 [Lachnospiraceae bacterium]|nr:translation initiation factor IF-2 [Lachnospiraceae bacterium]
MAKTQIMKITKELKEKGIEVSNKEVIEFLKSRGSEVTSHMSSISDEEAALVREQFGGSAKKEAPAEKKAEAPEAKKAEAPAEKKAEAPAPKKEAAPEAKKEEASKDNKEEAPKKKLPPKPVKNAPPKKKHIIFATNNRNAAAGNNRFNQGARQVYRISGGKIEDPEKAVKRTFKHTEVASPDAFEGIKLPPKEEEEEVKIIETRTETPVKKEEPAPQAEPVAPKEEVKEKEAAPQKEAQGPRKIYGNVYDHMPAKPASRDTQKRGGTYAGREEANKVGRNAQGGYRNTGNSGNRPFPPGRNERPGSFGKGPQGRGGFNAGPSNEAPERGGPGRRSDADRRRQSEARKRKDAAIEASMEEKAGKKFNPHGFRKPAPVEKPKEEEIKVIVIPETLTIRDLADHMKIQSSQIIKKLFMSGQVMTLNSEVSYEEAENIAADFDILCEHEQKVDVIEELLKEAEEDSSLLEKRPPVVCVMGHVDHGKTSLLDKIRATRVTEKESGGITQAIGAYMVKVQGQKITFLDTPGHEAFTAMRMRGASSTDIAVLVVAADDGVMPQTVEAINHAKAAGVEIIVAVNKIDKPSANIERVKQELSEYELIPEDWGGSTVYVPVSAKTGEGIEQLLEMIILTADVLELKANANRKARGLVLEARLDKGRGPVASILVQKGTLHVGDFIAVGACHGRVRAMLDENGKKIKEATPSTPAEILGLDDVPEAGEIFVSPESDKEAKNFADTFKAQQKNELLRETKTRLSLDDLYSQIKEGDLKEFNVIIKADVQGSVEALKTSLLKLSNEEVALKVIHSGVGAISESDVILASTSNAIIIGFNVKADNMAKQSAEQEEVDIRLYKVIYQAIDDMEHAMKGLLAPVYEEKITGHVEIRQIFKASQIGNIAGSYVTDGIVERGSMVRIFREGELIHEGKLQSLKRFKDDVKEVREGYECGLVFEDFNDVKELDTVECYKMVEVERK